MSAPLDLKLVVSALAAPPFNRNFSSIQLHDEVPVFNLLQLLTDVMAAVDQQNANSTHRGVDLRNEDPQESVLRMVAFLQLLKWKEAADAEALSQRMLDGDRGTILRALQYLLKDFNTHKKRAYLAPFLAAIDVPSEFTMDEAMSELIRQVEDLQGQFKEIHKTVDTVQNSSANAGVLKKEIQQLEDEKQQVQNKIAKIRKRVEDIPQHEQWLEAARSLRNEQQNSIHINERIKEQRHLISLADTRYSNALTALKDAKSAIASANPEALLQKLEEDSKMNQYLATENLPKQIEEARQAIRQLKKVLAEPALSDNDLVQQETEIRELNETVARLAEKKLAKHTKAGDDKLALFRQQAAIIARKKEGTTVTLAALETQVEELQKELTKKMESEQAQGARIPKGEEFKRYVAELRGKSTVYKKKKAEISAITAQYGILQRTEEILTTKRKALEDALSQLEKRHGVAGFHVAQETLEKVSERKAEVDELKGRTLEEISGIIQKLMDNINEKKSSLSPVIQELRNLRQQVQETESEYAEKKKLYDATMVGLESEVSQLEHETKGHKQDIANDQSRIYYLHTQIQQTEVLNERVMQEMKAYIGGDEVVEQAQKARGFKTYRDLYTRRLSELEHLGKNLREQQKDIKTKYEPNMKQIIMFNNVKKLLMLKARHNAKLLAGETKKEDKVAHVTKDRLVL
ncbi:hypothetical protein DFS34DRAFT_599192 [Phlyctochytrium arcticum]|nr:hypothetical protein DFS34DRAFT_599192 [Phlyctochytrium arcticum]